MSTNRLPVKLADNFQVGYFVYFPLSCIWAHEEYRDWYYMNYIDLVGVAKNIIKGDEVCVKHNLRYPDSESYFSRRISANSLIMFDEYDLELVNLKGGVVDFIKKNIDLEKYVMLFLNTKRLWDENTELVSMHDIFVYGYDDTQKKLNIGFMVRGQYELMTVSYSAVEKGFHDYLNFKFALQDKKKMIITFSLTNSKTHLEVNDTYCYVRHEYDERVFKEKINRYLKGSVSGGEMQISDRSRIKAMYCGIDTYELFNDYLHELLIGSVLTTSGGREGWYTLYNHMFPFYYTNHKKSIYDRLNYAYDKTGKSIYKMVADEYIVVVNKMEQIKNMHLRLEAKEQDISEAVCEKFRFHLAELKGKEYSVLEKLF